MIDLCPRWMGLKAARLIEQAYLGICDHKISSFEGVVDHLKMIAAKSGDSEEVQVRFNIRTEAGTDAYVEIIGSELRIGVAGTNSLRDWIINVGHIKDSLISFWLGEQIDSGYKLSLETLWGYVSTYLFFYQELIDKGIVPEIDSIVIAGHSAGGRVADWLAAYLSFRFNNKIPIELYTFASPLFKEFYSQSKLDLVNVKLVRYAIASDVISELPAKLFNCDRTFTQKLPAIALWKRPHQLQHFINYLSN